MLFNGQYNSCDSRHVARSNGKLSATSAKEEILKWGEKEFGMSNGE